MGHAGRQTCITLLEFALVAAIFAALCGGYLAALLYYEELAEKTVVESTVQNLRSGLMLQAAGRIASGRDRELADLLEQNPVDWLERPPAGYVGIRGSVRARDVEPGSWYYDPAAREIGYRPRLDRHLHIKGDELLRWRVDAVRAERGGRAEGLSIHRATDYEWF